MKNVFFITSFLLVAAAQAQVIQRPNDSVRLRYKEEAALVAAKKNTDYASLNQDSIFKVKLVALAQNNPLISVSDANIKISEAELARAKKSWLGNINAGANVNEFVIKGSPAANFFPKYNLGLLVPFDIFSKLKRDKEVAKQNLVITTESKKDKEQLIKTQVLIAYENYKERKEILQLERSYIEYNLSSYEAAQKAFTDGDMLLEDMNKTHQVYLTEKATLTGKERDYNVAILELEQWIGMPLSEAMKQ